MRFTLFEVTLFDFLYFSFEGEEFIMHIEEFPVADYPACGYLCQQHSDGKDDIIHYILMELF